MGRMVTGSIKDLVKIRCTLLIEGKENRVLVGGCDDVTVLNGMFSTTFSSRCAGVPVHREFWRHDCGGAAVVVVVHLQDVR